MRKRNNKEVIFAEVAPALKERLRRAVPLLNKDMTEITVQAVERELDRAARRYPELNREHFDAEAAA